MSGFPDRRTACHLSICIIAVLVLGLQVRALAAPTNDPAFEAALAASTNLCFPMGEELTYRATWGIIPVGAAKVTTGWVRDGDRWLIAIRYRMRSAAVISAIYPVDSTLESLIDPATFLPVRFIKKSREGRTRKHEVTEFDHRTGLAHWHSIFPEKKKQIAIRADTRDIIAFTYFMRRSPLNKGETLESHVLSDDKIYTIKLRMIDDEKIRLDEKIGTIKCVKIEPKASFDGYFVRTGRVFLWIAKSAPNYCVKMQARIPVANISVMLTDARVNSDPFNPDWDVNPD